jgi:predicted 2-oxoglutarate/Fe(II)-dependent dioxygenase YbiX
MRYTEEAHGVFALPLLSPSQADATVAHARRLRRWATAQVRTETDDGRFDSDTDTVIRTASILESPRAGEVSRQFERRLNSRVKPLVKHLWGIELERHEEPQVVRYRSGGHYHAHTDADQDLAFRYFTVICYLNDDFQGGGTSFPSLRYVTAPRRGRAIVFPSRYIHSAEPVVAGEKYVCVSWLLGPAPARWI